MGKKAKKPKAPKLYVCRGCCCGTGKKHPHSDAKALERLAERGAARAGVAYRRTKCLGPCGQGNIVVVRAGGTYRWFRKMDDEDGTRLLLDHLAEQGDVAAPPAELAGRLMRRRDGKRP